MREIIKIDILSTRTENLDGFPVLIYFKVTFLDTKGYVFKIEQTKCFRNV